MATFDELHAASVIRDRDPNAWALKCHSSALSHAHQAKAQAITGGRRLIAQQREDRARASQSVEQRRLPDVIIGVIPPIDLLSARHAEPAFIDGNDDQGSIWNRWLDAVVSTEIISATVRVGFLLPTARAGSRARAP